MYIYNETNTPFMAEKGNDIGVIYKTVHMSYSGGYTKRKPILVRNKIIDSLDKQKLSNAINTEQPVCVSTDDIAVYFCKKDLSPLIVDPMKEKTYNKTDILLSTIDIENKKIIKIDNQNVLLLNYMIHGNTFIFSSSFNAKSKQMSVLLYDEKTNELIRYIFEYNNSVISLKKYASKYIGDIAPRSIKIKTYTPKSITSNIVTYYQDEEVLKSVLSKISTKFDTTNHIVENKSLESTLVKLKEDNIRAITIFINSEELTEDVRKIYSKLFRMSKKHSTKIILLFNNGKILRFKHDMCA